MRKIDLVIFDCDGVLLDSEYISCECAVTAFESVGMTIDIETVFKRFLGSSRHDMGKAATAEGYTVSPNFAVDLETAVEQAFENRLQSIPGVASALEHIMLPRCVASSSPVSYIRRGLAITGLSDFFEPNLFSASMVKRGKPAPDLFLHAAKQMGAAPEHSLVIEDSYQGVKAANAAGMPVFWFLGGSHIDLEKRPPDFTMAHADLVFASMFELPTLIDSFCRK